jgi:hypothetical protein
MQHIGQLRDQALMYLEPRSIPETMPRDQLRQLFATTTAGVKEPWILVINCAGANPVQLMAAKRVSDVLRADYSDRIHGTWLMNASGLLRGFLNVFLTSAAEADAITFLETDRLGLFVQLQRVGCSHSIVDWFIQRLAASAL